MWPSVTGWTEHIKKRVCRYLLQRYLGQYLEEKLTLDQLTVDLYNGTGKVTDVSLDCHALNLLAEQQSIPVEFKEGHLETISVSIPLSSIMQESCEIEVSGLYIVVQPKKRVDNGSSMFNSMWTSMASSKQLAEECLKSSPEDDEKDPSQDMSGLEHCTQTIDAVLSRVKLCFRDTTIRIEWSDRSSEIGIGLEFQIKEWRFSDELSSEAIESNSFLTAYSNKRISIKGITCHSDIFKTQSLHLGGFIEKDIPSEKENTVLIAKLNGNHEIKLQIKKDESMSGPQVTLDCSFGSMICFLSPIQAHIVYKLIEEMISPNSLKGEESSIKFCKEKPMDRFDFQRIEEELQEHLKPEAIGLGGLQQNQGWSSVNDDSDDEFFQPMRGKQGLYNSVHSMMMTNSTASSAISLDQSVCDSLSTVTQYQNSPKRGNYDIQSQDLEKTKFSLSFSSCAIVLLHDDILVFSSTTGVLPETVDKMKELSRVFFMSLGNFGLRASGKRDLGVVNTTISDACPLSQLRCLAAPIKIEGLITGDNSISVTKGHVSFNNFELSEYLQEKSAFEDCPRTSEILNFDSSSPSRIDFKHKNYKSGSRTSVRVQLQNFNSEIDVSLVDRINSFIRPKLSSLIEDALPLSPEGSKPESVIDIKIDAPCCNLSFRFPIPDLRPESDVQKVHYWVRNIRKDYVKLNIKDFNFATSLKSFNQNLRLDTMCQHADIYYIEHAGADPLHFATVASDDPEVDGASMKLKGFDWPRVIVEINSEKMQQYFSDVEISDEDSIENIMKKEKGASPFSSKTVVHESLSHKDGRQDYETVIPGDRKEMDEFIESTLKNTFYNINLNLRSVEVKLHSKKFFEEIYNRICTDILLWEPSAPSNVASMVNNDKMFQGCQGPMKSFMLCKSGIKIDSDEESDDDNKPFYNPAAPGESRNTIKRKSNKGQSDLTLALTITRGNCLFNTPFYDKDKNIQEEKSGQFVLKVEDAKLFVVSGFKGDSNLGYLCLTSHKAAFFHCGEMDESESRDCIWGSPRLLRTVYPSEEGVNTKGTWDLSTDTYVDMLSVAVKIDRERDDLGIGLKNIRVAVGIKDGSLDYRMSYQNTFWFTQLTDFFDVNETPIKGYTPYKIVTELQLHLWNCAIIYKPLYLPHAFILSIDNFTLSSNIVAQTETLILKFLAEEAALFVSQNKNSIDIRNDYVCIIELDLIELSLRFCDDKRSEAPRFELILSNNVVNVRTCRDSFESLKDIIVHLANEGDLVDRKKTILPDGIEIPSSASGSNEQLVSSQISESQKNHINDMVEEAMKESKTQFCGQSPPSKERQSRSKQNLELHFEPEEINFSHKTIPVEDLNPPSYNPNPRFYGDPIMETSSPFGIDIQPSDDEEDFCILENDPGVGIVPKDGEPEAKILVNEPIVLVENHFSVPIGKMDILRAPKHYPKPLVKYSIQDMTLIWHIYGGEDFSTTPKASNGPLESESKESLRDYYNTYDQSDVDIGIDALNTGVIFSKNKCFESAWEAYEGPKRETKLPNEENWRKKGGKGRQHDRLVEIQLSKIKLQHELYPETTEQASRQVMVINTIEIRDRLRCSQFNKMLYLYTSPSKPRQSHANMILVKAAHIRPDPQLKFEECCLKVSLLPIRLNVDQDALLFLFHFFSDITSKGDSDDDESLGNPKPPSATPSVESLPVLTLNITDDLPVENLEDNHSQEDTVSISSRAPSIDSGRTSPPVFFRQVIFSPDVPIRLDYRGKSVDLTFGPLNGILMGLGQLDRSEIRLKRLSHRNGILGVDKLIAFMTSEWINDIKKNQLPSLLGGVGPMYSFVQLFQGIRDLFWLPIEQYQKDGRIGKGLQRGANAFSTSAAMAALELTNRMVKAIQGAAEITYDMVSPGPSVQQQRRQSSAKKKRYNQPSDIREGVTNAYNVVKEGIGDAAHTIVSVASKEHEQKGVSGAVGGVLRQIPPTAVRPIILIAEATSNVLDGFRSHIEPEFKKDAEEKWKE